MPEADPAVDELVAAALNAPQGLIACLLESDDGPTVRLGEALRTIQRSRPHPDTTGVAGPAAAAPTGPPDEPIAIDPMTHDPAW
ncbi:hypothetical protein ACFPM3_18455 [Streptomyces coeruleoprunus]|uniref:Uncharacterized protein n=1 Tax=Streptomyces coeruleoprunus TaxID=285563 RepID=A0ABV9XIC5_9ACTN